MSVDKFGRHSQRQRLRIIKGPPGEGFNLTTDGNYDMKQKRISNVNNAVEDNDAVNLFTLKRKCLFLDDDNTFDVNGNTLYNLKTPESESDATSKKYVDIEISNLKTSLKEISNKINVLKTYVEELNYISYLESSKDKPVKSKSDWLSSRKEVFKNM